MFASRIYLANYSAWVRENVPFLWIIWLGGTGFCSFSTYGSSGVTLLRDLSEPLLLQMEDSSPLQRDFQLCESTLACGMLLAGGRRHSWQSSAWRCVVRGCPYSINSNYRTIYDLMADDRFHAWKAVVSRDCHWTNPKRVNPKPLHSFCRFPNRQWPASDRAVVVKIVAHPIPYADNTWDWLSWRSSY